MNNKIFDDFNAYFDMVSADSDELKKQAYRLRYQVYCIEAGLEDPERYPEGLEYDEFDYRSVHYLIRHRKFGINVATTRLILPDNNNPEKPFPLEIHSHIENFEVLKYISRRHLAEISRFCIIKGFRKRINEFKTVTGFVPDFDTESPYTQQKVRRIPHIALALVACLIKMSYENDIHNWYGIIEPALIRVFSSLGMYGIKLGPITDYHGKRLPYTVKITDLLDGVAKKNSDYWNILTNNGQYFKK